MRTWVFLVGIAAALARAPHARADGDHPDSGYIGQDIPVLEIDDCPAKPQVDPSKLRAIGFEHFDRGEVLYVQGDYKGAVKELVAAYCISPFYSILKDIGQAYERELDYERAIAYLERYVMDMPKDAQKANSCATDPQEDRLNVIARVKSLRALRAKILVNTDPPDATVTVSNDAGIKGRGVAGEPLEVTGGRYSLVIERKGYHTVTQELRAEIGKPYTIFTKLEPRKGRLRLRTVPVNARLFLDQRQVGTGAFEAELAGGRYTISAEAADHVTVSKEIELLADRDTPIALDLPESPKTGRRQFIAYATVAGGVAGGTLAGASSDIGVILIGAGVGIGAGFFGSYYVTPHDLPLGTSSLTITSSLIGGTLGATSTILWTGEGNRIAPAIGSGLILGGLGGYYIGSRTRISPGDAAVINSGAVWGTVVGSLFTGSFEATQDRKIGAGITLSGLSMGTLAGVLMTRYFEVSRTRAALIDLGGAVGMLVGLAVQTGVTQTSTDTGAEGERTANYTLGGLATGLVLAGILTRNVDAPNLIVTPSVSKASTGGGSSTTTFGVSGSF